MRVVLGPFHPDLEDALVDELIEQKKSDLLAPLLVLVPSDPLLHRVKVLLARERGLNFLNLHVLTFHQLSRRLLDEGDDTSQIKPYDDAFAEEALRQMIQNDFQWQSVYSGIDKKEGGCGALWQTLRDLRDAKVDSQASLDALAEGYLSATGKEKIQDLFRLHGAFSSRSRQWSIWDYTDLDSLAMERAPSSKMLREFAGIVYYGFYDLTQSQLEFFQTVARHHPTTLLFPLVPGHPAWAFAQGFYDRYIQGLVTGSPEGRSNTSSRHTAFAGIHRRLFTGALSGPSDFKGSCGIVNCFDQRDEVLTTAKEILRVVSHHGIAFDEIGVVVRSMDSYLAWFREIFPDHQIPMALYAQGPLLSFPLVKAVLLLGELVSRDYRRSHVVDLVSSPYFKLDPYCPDRISPRVDLWDPMTRGLGITKGFEEWRRLERCLMRGMRLPGQANEDEEPREIPVAAAQVEILWSVVIALHGDLDALPAEAAWSDYAARWQALLHKYLGIELRERAPLTSSPEARIGDAVLRVLDAISGLDKLGSRVSQVHFLHTFQRWLERATIPVSDWNRSGVAVLDAMSARGLPFRVLFILGLNEGIFPRTIREDAFLRDSTRRGLETVLGYKISEKLAAYDEEKLILALLVGAAREHLYCFYRRSDDGGRTLAPSWYLEEIRRAVWGPSALVGSSDDHEDPAQERSIPRGIAEKGKVSPFREAQWLTPGELAVRSALQGRDPTPLLEMASQSPEIYRRGLRSVKLLDDPRRPPDRRDGIVGAVPDYWSRLLKRGVSPTSLERYARCPFQYFAVNLLDLHELQRPEELSSPGPSVIGQLSHRILKSLYSELLDEGTFAADASLPTDSHWSTRLEGLARQAYADYARDNPVGYPVAWEALGERLIDMLRQVVARDLAEMEASGFRPVTLEPSWQGRLEAGWPEPLGGLLVLGTPDRIDTQPFQSRVRVIDYKLRIGRTERTEDRNLLQSALRGVRLQLPLYVLLARQHAPDAQRDGAAPRIHGAFYLLAPRWADGPLIIESFPEDAWEEPYKGKLQETFGFLLQGIREGRFFISPGDHCADCEVAAVCRRHHRPSRWRSQNDSMVKAHRELQRRRTTTGRGRRGT